MARKRIASRHGERISRNRQNWWPCPRCEQDSSPWQRFISHLSLANRGDSVAARGWFDMHGDIVALVA